jgi:hypothetical protein
MVGNFNAKAQCGEAATKNNSIRKPGNQEFFPMVLGFLASWLPHKKIFAVYDDVAR